VEDEIRSLVVDLVSKAVTNAFPDAKVLPFGSFGTKLYLPLGCVFVHLTADATSYITHSDIDLVVQSQSMAYSDKVTVLHALANTLKRAGITSKVTIIAKAKVPIIKFITIHGRLNVDISVNQVNGVIASQIVNGFLKDMHGGGNALRSLVMVTKAFLNQRSMNEVYSGGLGSYSIVCLAVSFLQMHPKIRRGEIDAEKNLGVLVMEFFELYGCYFNYEEVGISVRDGGCYFSKRERGWWDYYRSNRLSIEDPIDPCKSYAPLDLLGSAQITFSSQRHIERFVWHTEGPRDLRGRAWYSHCCCILQRGSYQVTSKWPVLQPSRLPQTR
jgi:non-canonical poly(A) RNA polymerase PAPD5/7